MTREEILEQAKQIVCTDREETYGEPENNFSLIAMEGSSKVRLGLLETENVYIYLIDMILEGVYMLKEMLVILQEISISVEL